MKTWKNKICAITLVLCGLVPVFTEHDATALIALSLFLVIPMLLAKENWIY